MMTLLLRYTHKVIIIQTWAHGLATSSHIRWFELADIPIPRHKMSRFVFFYVWVQTPLYWSCWDTMDDAE